MIKVFLMDIDGVLTDGKVTINSRGEEQKRICFKDIDAFREFKNRGLVLGAITGEKTPITEYIRNRVTWDYFYNGAKNKIAVLEEIREKEQVSLEEICYIGDGKYDIAPLSRVGLAVCPQDAIDEVKQVSHVVLSKNGGNGCVWEMISVLDNYNGTETFTSVLKSAVGMHANILKQTVLDEKNCARIELLAQKLQDCVHNNGNLFLVGNRDVLPLLNYVAAHFNAVFAAEKIPAKAEVLNIAGNAIFKKLPARVQPHDVILSFAIPRDVNKLAKILKAAGEKGAYTVQISTENDKVLASYADIYIEDYNLANDREIFIMLWHFLCNRLKNSFSQDLQGKRRCS